MMKTIEIPTIDKEAIKQLLVNTKKQAECMLWQSGCNKAGYGIIYIKQKQYLVTRLVLSNVKGGDGIGLYACHTCDTPACINPIHLFWGTQFTNMQDAAAKGRVVNQNTYKTHCKNGHELIPENLIQGKLGNIRACNICQVAWREKNRNKSNAYAKLRRDAMAKGQAYSSK